MKVTYVYAGLYVAKQILEQRSSIHTKIKEHGETMETMRYKNRKECPCKMCSLLIEVHVTILESVERDWNGLN
jgi:hypothetical protein